MSLTFKPTRNKKILLSLECTPLQEELFSLFSNEGYIVKKVIEADRCVDVAKEFYPNLIFLGFNNFQQGINYCKEVKTDKSLLNPLVIMVSSHQEEVWEEMAFESGANDFLLKPIKKRALLHRIESHFKGSSRSEIKIGDITLNINTFNVHVGENRVYLTKKEFELLTYLIHHPFRVHSREELFEKVWDNEQLTNDRTVDVHINRIRDKIGKKYIQTVIRVGYKFMI